jgi:Tol biopolymer transport system component
MADGRTPISPAAGERLDSWKEISAYLKRDPRTLQRWEKKEHLPIHRHVHESQVSVYAYKYELDAWLAGRSFSKGNGAASSPLWHAAGRNWAVAAALAALTATTLFLISRTRPAPAPSEGRAFRQLQANAEIDFTDAVSPDGRYLSFTDHQSGALGIRDLVSGKNRLLTKKGQDSPYRAFDAAFSPDGKSIVYSWIAAGLPWEIHRIGINGGGERTLLMSSEHRTIQLQDWSPDGRYIAAVITTAQQEVELGLISPGDGSIRTLKRLGAIAIQRAVFSRDGRYLVYDAPVRPGLGSDIFLLSTDGKEDRPLIQHPANEFMVGWYPKGDHIVFGSDRTGTIGIWQVAFRQGRIQGEPQLLQEDVGRVLPLSVTRSGSVLLLRYAEIEDVYLAQLGSKDPPTRLNRDLFGLKSEPSFSPDGQSLLYHSRRDGTLRVRSLDSGAEREIHPRLNFFQRPRWADRGRTIEVSGTDGKMQGIWRVNAETGDVTLIQAGRPKPVYAPPEGQLGPGDPVPSPDGSWIAVAVRGYPKTYNSLLLVPVHGGSPRELVRLKQPEQFTASFAWSPDGGSLYFARHGEAGTDLMRISAMGGPMEPVGLHMPMIRNLSIHPDGKRITFEAGESNAIELWTLDGFLSR